MKFFLLFVIGSCTIVKLFANEPSFKKGDKVLSLGLGIGSSIYSGPDYRDVKPSISASFEIGVKDEIIGEGVISVGGYLAYLSYKEGFPSWGYNHKNFILGARGSFHYPLVNKLDSYTGIVLGYDISTVKEYGVFSTDNLKATPGGLVFAWFVGGRYYFSDKFAAMAELGVGITYLNIGVALKF